MREYGQVQCAFWQSDLGNLTDDGKLLALYLMTGPHASSTGVYHCPLLYMATETGLSLEEASKSLQRLIEGGFCDFDEASEWVFIHNMAKFQVGEAINPKDKRHKWLMREIDSMPKPLMLRFVSMYGKAFNIPEWKELTRGMQGASKPHRSQDHDQDHEHGQEQEHVHGHDARARTVDEAATGANRDQPATATHRASAAVVSLQLSAEFEQFLEATYPATSHGRNSANGWHQAQGLLGSGLVPSEAVLRDRLTRFRKFVDSGGYSGPNAVPSMRNWLDRNHPERYWARDWQPVPSKAQRRQDANVDAGLAFLEQGRGVA